MLDLNFGPILQINENDDNSTHSLSSEKTSSLQFYKSSAPVERPIRHLGSLCCCYPDPQDCTTCSLISKVDIDSFYSARISAGSSPCSSRLETSKKSETLLSNMSDLVENTDQMRKSMKLNKEELREMTIMTATSIKQLKEWYEYRINELNEQLELIQWKIDCERRMIKDRSEKLTEAMNDVELLTLLLDKCSEMYHKVRHVHLQQMLYEEVSLTNTIRYEEIKSKMKFFELKNIDSYSISEEEEKQLNTLSETIESLVKQSALNVSSELKDLSIKENDDKWNIEQASECSN